jgi:hypothetical protein
LTTVIDLGDRKVIGWALSSGMKAVETVIPAFKMAQKNRPIIGNLLFHSDRGVQYACNELGDLLGKNALITRSMSRKGNCWDNAVAESFFKPLKAERFSRNLSEALTKITELEKKHDIKVVATNEPLDIDPSDPNVFMQRAFRYLIANEELLRIRKRTKQGMRHAQESGRYLGRAPFYLNTKDVSDRSVIVVDEAKGPIIQKVFADYLSGIPIHLIGQEIKTLGFTVKGNSAIQKVLGNCVYAGMVKVPADAKRPGRLVKALHLAIVSEGDFWLA